jgi:molecular chaperone HscB
VSFIICETFWQVMTFLVKDKIREVVSALTKSVAEKDWKETKVVSVRLKYLNGIADAIKQRLDNM